MSHCDFKFEGISGNSTVLAYGIPSAIWSSYRSAHRCHTPIRHHKSIEGDILLRLQLKCQLQCRMVQLPATAGIEYVAVYYLNCVLRPSFVFIFYGTIIFVR